MPVRPITIPLSALVLCLLTVLIAGCGREQTPNSQATKTDKSAADKIHTEAKLTVNREKAEVSPMGDGVPTAWLTAGIWPGKAGLSSWGIDYEPTIRPGTGEPVAINHFDTRYTTLWVANSPVDSGTVVFESLQRDFSWPHGTAYAGLYLYSDQAQALVLHYAQSGSQSRLWLNGALLAHQDDHTPNAISPTKESASGNTPTTAKTDQGMAVTVARGKAERPQLASLNLQPGWNFLLLKCVTQQTKGEAFGFKARFTTPEGKAPEVIKTASMNPEPCAITRTDAARLMPLVYVDAPANLPRVGDQLKLSVDLESADYLLQLQKKPKEWPDPQAYPGMDAVLEAPEPIGPMRGRLELTINDYEGRTIFHSSQDVSLPGTATFDIGEAQAPGYYITHLRLYDEADTLAVVYPPDGFSVIGGAQAQYERLPDKKMSTAFYYINTPEKRRSALDWLEQSGIYRNIGGNTRPNVSLYEEAYTRGIELTADLWSTNDQEQLETYVQEVAPFVDSFKAYNEVDFHPDTRGTPEAWVATAKVQYEAVKRYAPGAKMLGASLVIRLSTDTWVEDCIRLGLDKYVDAWDVHAYPQKPPSMGGHFTNSPLEGETALRTILHRLGITDIKPLWIGETGAWTNHGLEGRRWQADTVAKMTACAISRNDIKVIGFLRPWGYDRTRTGIWGLEAGHMPAEAAYYTASALIDGFDYVPVYVDEGIEAGKFGPTTMLWCEDRKRTVNIDANSDGEMILVDVVGRVKPLTVNEEGKLSVPVSSSPVYILSRENYESLTR